MKGSLQLRAFLRSIRAGLPVEIAAQNAEIPLGEARLHAEAEHAGEYSDIDTTTLAAGPAASREDNIMPKTDETFDELPAPDIDLAELAADTLRGDVRDSLLSWFRCQQKPWSAMGEAEQRNLADAADRYAGTLIKQACQIIAAGERPCIVANLVEYKEKDGVEAKLKFPSKGEVILALHEACGREVLIVTSGAEEYLGEAAPAEIDADQPKFPNIGEEYDEAA